MNRIQIYHLRFPWMSHYSGAKQRCTNIKDKKYHRYGGRGIKFLMTKEDFKFLWFRDKAYLMSYPTIDRKNNDGNYELSNCEFIENSINTRKDRKLKAIYQYKNNKIIKEWKSIREASRILNIPSGNICHVLKGRKLIAYGFSWKYKE